MKLFCSAILVATLSLPVFSQPSHHVERNPPLSAYQQSVISYFREVALGFEFGTASNITRKWVSPMKIFLEGTPSPELASELNVIVNELNVLISEDFRISIVSHREEANLFVYCGNSQEFGLQYPEDAALANKNSGVYHIYWNRRNEITRGHIFVKMNGISLQEQRSVLREEVTQSLGLGKDSPTYHDSIFQSAYTTPTKYANIDKDLIRLLYHPRMRVGLTWSEVEIILAEILAAENGA